MSVKEKITDVYNHVQNGTAMEAFENLGPDKRHISSLTLAMSRQKYQQFCDQLDALREQWLEEAANDPNVDGVYQINLQVFPLTQLEENFEEDSYP